MKVKLNKMEIEKEELKKKKEELKVKLNEMEIEKEELKKEK